MLGVDARDAACEPCERRRPGRECARCQRTGESARWAAHRVGEVGGDDPVGVGGDAQVGERGAQTGPAEQLVADMGQHRDARLGQRHLWGEQRRGHTGEHGDVARPVDGEQLAQACDRARGRARSSSVEHLEATAGHGIPCGAHLLVDADGVVREQVGRSAHDRRRTAVVDAQRVRRRTVVALRQVDEHARCRARVAVDRLVVVAHGEQLLGRSDEQPHEEDERGREVLRLVDEQVRRAAGGPGAQHRVGEQQRDREMDLLVEVERAASMQQPPVARHERGEPGHVPA